MVNSYVAKHNQEQSGVNVKMIRYYIRDGSLVAVLDILFMVCVSTLRLPTSALCDPSKFRQQQENIGHFSFYGIVKGKRGK